MASKQTAPSAEERILEAPMRTRKRKAPTTPETLAAAAAEKMIGHLWTGPSFGPEPMDSTDIDAEILNVARAIAQQRGEDNEDGRELAERDAAYIIGVQVGLRLRGVQ